MAGPAVEVVRDEVALGRRSAELVVASLSRAISARGRAHVALTGGGTALTLYRALATAPFRDAVDWQRVELWWGDDRYVPYDHHDSNVLLVEETLLGMPLLDPGALRGPLFEEQGARPGRSTPGVRAPGEEPEGIVIPVENVHPFPIPESEANGGGRDWCAARYGQLLATSIPTGPGALPVFDLVLLGVGPDGHFLSVFPGSPLVDATAPPLCHAVAAPTMVGPHVPRVTISPRLVEVAGDVLVIVSGPAKAGIMRDVLAGPRDPHRHPSQIAARDGATWLLDQAAAADLPEAMLRSAE